VSDTAIGITAQERAARETEAAVRELIEFIEACTEDDWHLSTPAEDWTVGVVAHHVAFGFAEGSDWIELARHGTDIPGTVRSHDDENAAHARDHAGASRAETIVLARENGTRAVATVRALRDDELSRSAAFGPSGGSRITVERLAGAFRRHFDRHMDSIREALAA
jgi:hypothetical protein